MPPGTEVFGPRESRSGARPQPSPAAPPPEGATPTADAGQRSKARIDELLNRLASATDATEAASLIAMVERLWLQSGSDTADLLTTRAVAAMDAKDYATADDLLSKVVQLRPAWAEGWNKLATVHFLEDQDSASMSDIGHVLAIEPRHFGALSGMGFILHRNGDDKAALTVLRRAAAINPQNKDIKGLIEQLTPGVEGHGI